MGIVIKFILKNIYEKKFRTFLILFSIIISSALFFASGAMQGTMVKMFEDRMKNYTGTSEIIIHTNEKSPSGFFNMEGAEKYADRFEYIVGVIQGSAGYRTKDGETVSLSLVGADIGEFMGMNPVVFESEKDMTPFSSQKIVISKNTADKYGLKLGDVMELEIGRAAYKFTITGICQPTGLFFDDGISTYAVIPRDTLASIYDAKGRVNLVGIKLKEPLGIKDTIALLSGEYDRFTVREPMSKEELAKELEGMTTTFMLMAMTVAVMSIFIIFTSFKVVTMERLPVIGTFRSIGATRKTTDAVLLAESAIYGIVGGIAGCGLGIGILYLMAVANRPIWEKGFKASIEFSPDQLAAAFLFAVALSFASCIIPIIQISRIPVKDIVLNAIEKKKRNNSRRTVLGLCCIAFSFLAPPLAPKSAALIVDAGAMMLSVVAVVFLIPGLTGVFVKVFENIYLYVFGNIGTLAAKNLRENKSILNNVSLLAIGISSLLMINTISGSVVKEIMSFYRTATFDVWIMYLQNMDKNFEMSVAAIDGVEAVYGAYEAYGVEISDDGKNRISLVQGVDKSKFGDFMNVDIEGDAQAMYEKLDEGRNLIITENLGDKLRLGVGDKLTLKLGQGEKTYEIIGFMNSLRNNGSYALASERFIRLDTGSRYYSNTFVKTSGDPAAVAGAIRKAYARRYPYIKTVREMQQLELQSNANTFLVLQGFAILALVIGIFGVLNNLVISFIERKRFLAMYRAVGMSRKQILRMILIEALTGGFIGGAIGIISGLLMISRVPYVLKAINLWVPLHYPLASLYVYVLTGIIIVVVASISPAVKSSRLNIIEAVKYE